MKKLIPLLLCLLLLTGCAEAYDGPTVEKTVLASEHTEHYNSDGSISYTTRTEYAYDIYGNESQILTYNHAQPGEEMEPHLKTVNHYDDQGRVTRHLQYDVSGWLPRKIIDTRYTYDDQGRMTSQADHCGWDRWSVTITYDDENRTRTTRSSENIVTVEYLDKNGWVIRSESTIAGEKNLEEFDLREDGQVLCRRFYTDGILEAVTSYTYDNQGRVLTHSIENISGATALYQYEYGENYRKTTYDFGSYYIVWYYPDGTEEARTHHSADGTMTELTTCTYTTIRVPAKEETP